MKRTVKVADLFCGAGGSSTGAKRAIEDLGRRMDLVCVNHWDRAIETHKKMHPEARHYCQDVTSARPIECVPEGKLDLLMASPTCTYHSRARGARPVSDQQRMDPWAICSWLSELRVGRVLIENVPEYADWAPVAASTGRPIKAKRGQYHNNWVAALDGLGYDYVYKIINCADHGDPTTRVRYFGMARHRSLVKRGIRWPHPTHAREPSHDLLGPLQRWRAARECIDWSHRGNSIYTRSKGLSPKTLLRIYAGITKFGWPERYVKRLRRYLEERGIEVPAPKDIERRAGPFMIRSDISGAPKLRGRPVEEPMQTIVSSGGIGLVEPFVLAQGSNGAPRTIGQPLPTVVAVNRTAFVLAQGEGGVPRQVEQPLPAIPCGGAHALIAPYYGGGSGLTAKSAEEPLPTVTTLARFGLVVPITHAGGGNRARSIDSPVPTLTTAHRGELAFITSAFGERDGQMPRVRDIADPAPSICAQGYVPLVDAGGDDDILYRMLQPRELARAMSFSDESSEYEFVGNKTEITRQIGNAVPVRTAAALVKAALWDLEA